MLHIYIYICDISRLRVNGLVSITAMESVYSAVRNDFLDKADYVSSLKG